MPTLTERLLPEFDREMAGTRKLLERVPEAKAAWKPHPKSYALGDLAVHVATLPHWATTIFEQKGLDFNEETKKVLAPPFAGTAALLELFDRHHTAARAALLKVPEASWAEPWAFTYMGHPVFTRSKYDTFRGDTLNHLIHHRAQLTVYLRQNDVPLPNLYGPTADEQ